jgi:pyruvate/2-oxoglutarate/acetoin dehydrogenase E1 component
MKAALSVIDGLTTKKKQRYTQVGLALYGLKPVATMQYSLFEDPAIGIAEEKLQCAMDTLHARYGRDSVTRAAALPVRSGTRKELDLPMVE